MAEAAEIKIDGDVQSVILNEISEHFTSQEMRFGYAYFR